MGIKIRKEVPSKLESLIQLTKERTKVVNTRNKLTKEVDEYNANLISQIKLLLEPICAKVGFGIGISIKEYSFDIRIPVNAYRSKTGMSLTGGHIEMSFPALHRMEKPQNINAVLNSIERYMRLVRRMAKREKLFPHKTSKDITVSLQTRNKYF